MSVSFSWSRAGDATRTSAGLNGAGGTGGASGSGPMAGSGANGVMGSIGGNGANNMAAGSSVGASTAQSVSITDQLSRVRDAWDPASPNSAFQYYFYNKIPADQAALYQMPPGQDPAKWEQALLNRPDNTSVPVLAIGFDDLEKRLKQQKQTAEAYRGRMQEIKQKLTEMQNRHDLRTTVKLAEMRERHSKLSRRTLALAVKLQVLTHRGQALSSEEELFRRQLQEYLAKADDPTVFGSLNEVWARVTAADQQLVPANSDEPSEDQTLNWEQDKNQLDRMVKVLAQQQTGIKFLANLLEEDAAKVTRALEPKPAGEGVVAGQQTQF